jgi:hypothetical protein
VLTAEEMVRLFALGVGAGALAWVIGYGWLIGRRALQAAVSE